MTLADWQTELSERFEALSQARHRLALGRPLFALEHGLEQEQLNDLKHAVRTSAESHSMSCHEWLPWVVYAAEHGYEYEGDEYWQSFGSITRGWDGIYDNRHRLKNLFLRFCDLYNGARPTGRWAGHFSIICWPITHALLPRDLQIQLARVLYDVRYSITPDLLTDAEALGNLIATYSIYAKSRFRNFVQDPLLVGQIAAALLLQGDELSANLIRPDSLKRIIFDLYQAQSAKLWLRSAQQHVKSVTRHGIGGRIGGSRARAEIQREAAAHALRSAPEIVLRPTQEGSWDVLMDIPSLASLATLNPKLSEGLCRTRFRIRAKPEQWWPGQSLLYSGRRARLANWPQDSIPLLEFENKTELVDSVLEASYAMPAGPLWLFRVGPDGSARALREAIVRPDAKYLLLSTDSDLIEVLPLTIAEINCVGVVGRCITACDADAIDFARLGLTLASRFSVTPVGLPPLKWDGEGYCEVLTSERTYLSIQADETIKHISAQLDDIPYQTLDIDNIRPSSGYVIEIEPLPAGLHSIVFGVSREADGPSGPLGALNLRVMHPKPWTAAILNQGIFFLNVEPAHATLEDLWDCRVSVQAHGPAGRDLRAKVRLFANSSPKPLWSHSLPPQEFPLRPAEWLRIFTKQVREDSNAQKKYDLASRCEVILDAEELGTYTFEFDRSFTPLRWVVRVSEGQYSLGLIDDIGSKHEAEVEWYRFREPDHPYRVKAEVWSKGFVVDKDGGLFRAHSGEYECAIAIPPRVTALAGLSIDPRLHRQPRAVGTVTWRVDQLRMWMGARVTGQLVSLMRQREVALAIVRSVFLTICGSDWLRVERCYERREGTESIMRAMRSYIDDDRIGWVLSQGWEGFLSTPVKDRPALLAQLLADYVNKKDLELVCWTALVLASDPNHLHVGNIQSIIESSVERLLATPVIAAAARFLVLVTDVSLPQEPLTSGRLVTGWEWQ